MSDLHLGEETLVDEFDAQDERAFELMLAWLRRVSGGRRVELILLGDIIELWETPPYFTSKTMFDERIARTERKVTRVVQRHQKVFRDLQAFAQDGNRVHYVMGNHDDDLFSRDPDENMRPELRFLRDRLSAISQVPFEFSLLYLNRGFRLRAQHGHQFDEYNFARQHGEKVFGRWIVEQFSTQLEATLAATFTSDDTRAFPFRDFDVYEPTSKYGEFVRSCLRLTPQVEQRLQTLARLANELAPVGTLEKIAKALAGVFNLEDPFEKFFYFAGIAEFLGLGDHPDTGDARDLLGNDDSCVVMGHTHKPRLTQFSDRRVYVNTGSWHDRIRHNEAAVCQPIRIPTRETTVLFNETPDQVRIQMYSFDFPDRPTFAEADQPRLQGQLVYKLTE